MAVDLVSVPEEVRTKYVNIIDDILSNSDLTQITEKRIRQGIANRVEHDITPQKVSSAMVGCGWRLTSLGPDQGSDHGAI